MSSDKNRKLSKAERKALKERGIILSGDINHGAYGNVYQIKSYRGRNNLCIKYFYDIEESYCESIRNEFKVTQQLYNIRPEIFVEPVAFEVFEVYDTPYKKGALCACIVMERLEPYPFSKNTSRDIAKLLYDISLCIGFMHKAQIAHRDIKPDNILIKKSGEHVVHYVLCDFGTTITDITGTIKTYDLAGSPYYMSPEACREVLSLKGDLYSLGMVCRELIMGTKEYGMISYSKPEELINYLIEQKRKMLPLRSSEPESQKLVDIINKLTEFDRDNRYDEDCIELLTDINAFVSVLQKG